MLTSEQRTFADLMLQCHHGWEVRAVVAICGMPRDWCLSLLISWIGKGWYDYGLAPDLGWLTQLGRKELSR